MDRWSTRLACVAALALGATLGACGSEKPDAEVRGARIARDEPVAIAPRVEASASLETEGAASTAAPAESSHGATENDEGSAVPETPSAPPESVASADATSLTLEFRVDATTIPAGTDVTGTLVAHNPTASVVDLTHPNQCETEQGLYDAAGTLVSEPSACAMAVRADQIGPGETRTWPIRIRSRSVAPGTYDARAGINLGVDVTAAPVSITVSP
ncbi:MAG TPA: BsuPI-related putative proteinase inhibitor [Acidimicrobiia bacterium]|nr:BsuPI-related putative proteinase inhibitor [Acidimicrobiia bacterium]